MRYGSRFSTLIALISLLIGVVASAAAQQITFYPDFAKQPSAIGYLYPNGSAHLAMYQAPSNPPTQTVLRLTDGGSLAQHSTVYFTIQQPLSQGFTTWFEFQIHGLTANPPGDGFAFIVQNSTATDSTMGASGSGITALGAGNGNAGGGMGYAGINNSLAVEFDVLADAWDPNSNHIAVQSCGVGAFNTPVHLPGDYTIGNNHHVESCLLNSNAITGAKPIPILGGSCSGGGNSAVKASSCTDGMVHQAVIEYMPPPGSGSGSGSLQIWIDPPFVPGTHTPASGAVPAIATPFTIAAEVDCSQGQGCPAYVGFTASQPTNGEIQDILAWEFTPHADTFVTQEIQNGTIPTVFPFGGHKMINTYPAGFQNDQHIQMTVNAMLVDQLQFYVNRLQGTDFANETCIPYLQTGGQCVVYQVTCQDQGGHQVDCPAEQGCEGDTCITIQSTFTSLDPLSSMNVDLLKAPNDTNNWITIFSSYDPNQYDGVVSGKGNGFSDVVATIKGSTP